MVSGNYRNRPAETQGTSATIKLRLFPRGPREDTECYDTITASDPKVFVAALVEMLATYPLAVIARAADPARGLPALVKYPNLASFREQLEKMLEDYDRDMRRERHRLEREKQNQLSARPQLGDAEKARVIEGFRQLKARPGD